MTKGREDAETAANNDGTIAQRAGSGTGANQVNANGSRTPRHPPCFTQSV